MTTSQMKLFIETIDNTSPQVLQNPGLVQSVSSGIALDSLEIGTPNQKKRKINSDSCQPQKKFCPITKNITDFPPSYKSELMKLSENEMTKIQIINEPDKRIPTLSEILDLDVTNDQMKTLVNHIVEINKYYPIELEYTELVDIIMDKINLYAVKSKKMSADMIELYSLSFDKSYHLLLDRIVSSSFNSDIKSILYDAYRFFCEHALTDSDKKKKWIETVLSLPRSAKTINRNYKKILQDVSQQFDDKCHGMKKMKEELSSVCLNIMIGNQVKPIGLCSPEKNELVKIMANVLDLPFERIDLGMITNQNFLIGDQYGYITSDSGAIVKSIIRMGYTNGIIYLDNMEKINDKFKRDEIVSTLISILDLNFQDKYLQGIKIDMTNYLFICSMTTTEDIDMTLLNKMTMIKFDGYSVEDKDMILRQKILPKILQKHELKMTDIVVSKSVLLHIISKAEQPNVNVKVKEVMNKIISRINLYKYTKNLKIPYTITTEFVDKVWRISDSKHINSIYA